MALRDEVRAWQGGVQMRQAGAQAGEGGEELVEPVEQQQDEVH